MPRKAKKSQEKPGTVRERQAPTHVPLHKLVVCVESLRRFKVSVSELYICRPWAKTIPSLFEDMLYTFAKVPWCWCILVPS